MIMFYDYGFVVVADVVQYRYHFTAALTTFNYVARRPDSIPFTGDLQ